MKNSFFLLHISILLAGLTGIFGKLIDLNEVLITFYRMLFSSIILFVISIFYKKQRKKYTTKQLVQISATGFLLGLHWIFFYASIKYSNISVGVVCFCLAGFFTAILEPIINKKKASISELSLSFLTIIGISLIFSFDTSYRLGIILGVISSILVALFTIYNSRLTKNYDTYDLTKFEMLGGTIGIVILLPLILYFYPAEQILPNSSDFLYLIFLSCFCTILLYFLLNIALKNISAFTVNLSFNLEPIYTIVIAILFFDEYKQLNLSFFMGLTLIVASLILQMIRISKLKKNS